MGVRLKKPGLYEAYAKQRGRFVSAYGPTESGAQEALTRKLASPLSAKTFGPFSETVYLPTVYHVSPKWQEQIEWALNTHILPVFTNTPLADLTRHELQAFLNAKLRTLSRTSVGHLRKVLHAVLGLAEADRVIPSNPVRHVKLPPPKRTIRPTLDPADVRRLVTGSPQYMRRSLFLCGFCGLRKTEAAHAKIGKDRVLVESGKTASSVREVPLPPWVCKWLRRLPAWDRDNVTRSLRLACQSAKVKNVTLHELRHSFATNLKRLGCPVDVREELLGHKANSLERVYAHESEAVKLEWIERLIASSGLTEDSCKTL